ncbi:MAG: class aldolase/adducin family protein [Actinomycetia bacterium]|nr:class aldolase/adducin family protein [Actinomycetes bacterium]
MRQADPRTEIALLARSLYRQGYCDQLAGHITYKLPDGTLLVNPWELAWDELAGPDILRIDLDGNKLEGRGTVPGGIPLHLELHRSRTNFTIAVHNHSRWGTVWCDLRRIPPVYDQTGAFVDGDVAFFDEFEQVGDHDSAAKAVAAFGNSKVGLLANHGVLVVADSFPQAYVRAVTLEWRCRQAWIVESAGGAKQLPAASVDLIGGGVDGAVEYPNMMWEAAARREMRLDPATFGAGQSAR